jgi:hypothetical protein
MTARVHLALLALAIVVLVAGGLVAFLLWRPQTHHSIQVNRQAQVQVPPRARRLVPEVSEKDKSRLAAAAGRVPLGTVMHWYGQQRFTDGNAPGTMSLPSECLKEAQADPKLAKWLENWQTNLHNRAPPSAQRSATPGAQRSDAPDSSSPGSSTPDSATPISSPSDHSSEDAQDDSTDPAPQHAPQRNSTTPRQLRELEQILQASPLKALPLLDIGRAVDFFSDDETVTSRFYAAAGLRGAKEASGKLSALDYRKLLFGLNSTRPLLWRVIDGQHDKSLVPGLYAICETVSQWRPSGSGGNRILDSDQVYARIDAAECLWLEGKIDQGLAAARSIKHGEQLSPRQARDLNWSLATMSFGAKKYAEALPLLRAAENENRRAFQAQIMLVRCLAEMGNPAEAQKVIERIDAQHAPSRPWIASLEADVEKIVRTRSR